MQNPAESSLTPKHAERVLMGTAVLAAATVGVDALLLGAAGLPVLSALLPFPALAALLSALVWLRVRLAREARDEERERDTAARARASGSLFDAGDSPDLFTTARAQRQFERFAVPWIAPLFAVVQGAAALWLYARRTAEAAPTDLRLFLAAVLAGQAFALFLTSRYVLGLARRPEARLLRGPGVLTGLACLASVLTAAAHLVAETALPAAETGAAWVLIAFLALLAVETLFHAVRELYRPGRKRTPNVAYESRLGALLTDPSAWVANVAAALDYQFGFGLSETWFYRFLERALLPLVFFQVAILYLLSCVVVIGPAETGILEHLGRPRPENRLLHSGMHFKAPWPFQTVRRFPTGRLLSIRIGLHHADPRRIDDAPPAMLWSDQHHEDQDLFLVATRRPRDEDGDTVPVSLLNVAIPIEYRITNVFAYAYHYAEPDRVLEETAHRIFSHEAASRDLFDIMAAGQAELARALRRRLQDEADRLRLGVAVLFVSVQNVHPPAPVAPAFESVIGAEEERAALIHRARTHAARVVPLAEARGDRAMAEAQAFRVRRERLAEAESARFESRRQAAAGAPGVARTRWYLRSLNESLTGARKVVVAAHAGPEVVQINLEEKLNPDLFDLSPRFPEGSEP